MSVHIRAGTPEDVEGLAVFDEVARVNSRRVDQIARAVRSGACLVAERDGKLVGNAVLTYNFCGNGMIELVYVARDSRRSGVGRALVEFVEALCKTPKLFTSTNLGMGR